MREAADRGMQGDFEHGRGVLRVTDRPAIALGERVRNQVDRHAALEGAENGKVHRVTMDIVTRFPSESMSLDVLRSTMTQHSVV